jgi:hypothetical protein
MEPLRIFVQTLGLNPSGDRHGSGWADFDNDGDLDLSVTQGARGGHSYGEKKDELWQNKGTEKVFRSLFSVGDAFTN